jgi:hypothetical protein
MGEIISAEVFKRRQQERAKKKPPTTADIQSNYDLALNSAVSDWEHHFICGTLSSHFSQLLGKEYGDVFNTDVIKQIETDLHLNPVVFSPNSMPSLPDGEGGWIAGFSMDQINYATPPMLQESYARALNALIFIQLKEQRKNA